MQLGTDFQAMDLRADVAALKAAVARSEIIVTMPAVRLPAVRLPVGFDEVDGAILQWIAAEGRRVAVNLVRM